MTASVVSAGALLGSTGADITPVLGTETVGQVAVTQAVARSNAVTCLTPAGWTLLAGPSDSGTTWRSYWFWKAITGVTADPLHDWSAVTGDKYGRCYLIDGADTANPFVAQAVTMGTADPGVATGVTTTAASQLVASFGMMADNLATTVAVTATDPASWANFGFTTIATGADAGAWASSATRATVGATGNVSHDFDAAPLAWAILITAIQEPAPPNPVPDVVMAPPIPA